MLQQLRRLDERLEALESRRVPPPPSGPCAVAVDTEALRLQLRQTLRAELGALRGPAAPPPVAAAVPVPTPTPAPTPENMEAFDKGQRLVEEAISSRRRAGTVEKRTSTSFGNAENTNHQNAATRCH